jgi:hypothetical protein
MEAHRAQATATRRSGDFGNSAVSETRKLAAILVSDVVGYWRLAGADEDRILARPGRDEEAVAWLSRSIEISPISPMANFHFAAASARLGRLEEARDATRAGLELNPSFTIARFR